eukprot:CAMPEP_0194241188 /NCGR_PEP_ID=MMETSP0158-20130606/7123_1 /TAXON_ID=33649 /ORGANISM="Thalassionema nitzschioides, Strain L26-B" /LENGTH=271 /DNA_ID=CAMNT_0038976031 /DNA_START=46 /DNA_END=861 /DNA_ORIENTATION=+
MVNCGCLIAALCFVVSNILGIVVIVMDISQESYDAESWRALDSQYLMKQWEYRSSTNLLQQLTHIFNALGWLFFVVPILQLAWALSRGGRRRMGVHAAIAGFAISACISEVSARLLMIGASERAIWISKSFNLEDWNPTSPDDLMGWKALEVSNLVVESMTIWVDAFEWIALFFIMVLLYFSVGTQVEENRLLPMNWARLGLLIAFLTFIDFSADILRLEEWKDFAKFAIFTSIVNTLIFLPLWLIVLSCHMDKVAPRYVENDEQWNQQVS